MQKELLATLADLLGCSCLSDLKYITDPYELKSVLNSVPAQNYPLKQWNDAVSYLCSGKVML